MSYRTVLAAAWLAAIVPVTCVAETIALNPNHPDRYVVKKGDTLWDIAGQFLSKPWAWPSIWQVNPQIRDPDLIYPGDELALTYENGQPVIRVSRRGGRPVYKLSPKVRATRIDRAIPTIPIEAIQQFLLRPRIMQSDEIDDLPYVVSFGKEHITAGVGARAYARDLRGDEGERFVVLRRGRPYKDPSAGDALLGYEATYIGEAALVRGGDPATLDLTRTVREVLPGDRLLPIDRDTVRAHFVPRAPDGPVNARIIGVVDGLARVGRYQTVVLNKGTSQGMKTGHVLAVYEQGLEVIDKFAVNPKLDVPEPPAYIELDPQKQDGVDGFSRSADRVVRKIQELITPEDDSYRHVKLPNERAGVIMVVRPFETISYALVMAAERPIHLQDFVRNP